MPPVENSRQGKALQTVYGRWRKKGFKSHSLQVGFGNPGSRGVKYCSNQKCKNDGFQVQDKSIKKRDEEPLFKFYRTGSGMVLGSLTKIDTPSNFTREVDDQEKVAAHFDAWKEDVDGEDVHVMSDTVLEEMPIEEAMKHFEGDA